MDIREKKTKRSIRNAFLQLRAHKPLERVRVKELAELAEISKTTFYLHYHDVYELSEELEQEVIQDVLANVSVHNISNSDGKGLVEAISLSCYAQKPLIDILFSHSRASLFPIKLERAIKKWIFESNPELEKDDRYNVLLTYQIQGSFYAYHENCKNVSEETISEVLSSVADALKNVNTP